jgi:hypothetical protein
MKVEGGLRRRSGGWQIAGRGGGDDHSWQATCRRWRGRGVERSSDRELLLQQQPFLLFNSVHWEGHVDISMKKRKAGKL